MPSEEQLLRTPVAEWGQLPRVEIRRQIYGESDAPGIVRWEVFVAAEKRGLPERFRFILFSPEYDRLVGVGHAEMAGRTVFESCTEHDAVKIAYQYEECVRRVEPISYPEYLEIGGRWRWWRTSLQPVLTPDGRVWKLVGWSEEIRSIEADLRTAIANEALEVYYQPICRLTPDCVGCLEAGGCDVTARCLVGYEALIRWPNSGYGPGDFLPLAKQNGAIAEITDFVIESVARKLTELDERLWVSMNVSDFLFEATLEAAVERHGIAPQRLRLEITEDTDMSPTTIARFRYVRLLGHVLELDDFWAERSGPGWIALTEPVAVKLDRQFVTEAHNAPNKTAICKAAIGLAKQHNPPIEVIVEGVETLEDLRFMYGLGADMGQGWLLGKPMPL